MRVEQLEAGVAAGILMLSSTPGRLTARIAAPPVMSPFPGWFLGAGQSADLASRFRKSVWRLLRSPLQIEWLEGLRLTLDPGNEICQSIFVTGRYEPNEFSWLGRVLKPGMAFVDVGANLGVYTLFAARRVSDNGRVIAIEPSSREMQALRGNVELNSLTNVSLVNVAVSDHAGEIELLVASARHAGHNTVGAFGYDTQLEKREKVRVERVDDILESASVRRVDVIKMDIEGAEFAALRGATATLERHRPTLLLELSDRALIPQKASSAEVLAFLESYGYETYAFDGTSGRAVPLQRRDYFDSENIIAVPRGATP